MNKKSIYKFCPVCRGDFIKKQLIQNEPERLVCKACKFIFYLDPKLVACTIAETSKGIVLQRRNKEPKKGHWVLPGGFVDRGETLEEAAKREFFEETGLHSKINCLLGTYSYPGEANIIIVYKSDITGGTIRACHESMSIDEFKKNEIPWDQLAFDTTKKALKKYIDLAIPPF
ncbi:MAG: NUDIX hydrolase [Desulfobacula sp.]|uniref:NUDIX domain-containing protein n=1 Tax=Desulfobacula sp. TaxID=2593537 RepID=UPI001DFF5CCC|nr:NUDIX hydrolase [Desulfobacula sp.]MBT4874040.1 NUDIX hydrolase [Desulfobacula sp.]MBT7051393.1 NUDIX hydrolase [Desulfobacula sp.]